MSTKSRTMSMELAAIRAQMQESPPPPPAGATVREWFAGLALMNPELMRGLTPPERVTEAARLADELVRALACPRSPSQETMQVPQDEAGLKQSWEGMARVLSATPEQNERGQKPTVAEKITQPDRPAVRHQTLGYGMTIPPPPAVHFRRASDMMEAAARRAGLPFPTTHSSLRPNPEEE